MKRIPVSYRLLLGKCLLLMGFYTLLRLLFLLFNSTDYASSNTSDLLLAFLIGLRFDLVAITIINLPTALLHFAPEGLFRTQKWQQILFILFILLNIPFLAANPGVLEAGHEREDGGGGGQPVARDDGPPQHRPEQRRHL
ncbi:MAG: hypothetical protein ACKOA1_11015, partial [Bacteroidota bacterium]